VQRPWNALGRRPGSVRRQNPGLGGAGVRGRGPTPVEDVASSWARGRGAGGVVRVWLFVDWLASARRELAGPLPRAVAATAAVELGKQQERTPTALSRPSFISWGAKRPGLRCGVEGATRQRLPFLSQHEGLHRFVVGRLRYGGERHTPEITDRPIRADEPHRTGGADPRRHRPGPSGSSKRSVEGRR